MDDYYSQFAIDALNRAGRMVTPAPRVPGLYDIAGLASDVTINQLWQLAQQHGLWNVSPNAFNGNAFGKPPQ